MEITELLKRTRELELISLKHAHSLLSGEYVTSIAGRGLQFLEARKYVYGESVRMIDWNMTARLGEPYVKSLFDEREREIFIALDISPSMYTGFQDRTKIEFAIEVAATICLSAIESKDKLGYILFNDKAVEVSKPSAGRIQLFRVLKTLVNRMIEPVNKNTGSDIRAVLHALQRFKKNKFVIFVISDFLDADIPDDLKYARAEHDINFLHIYDPIEYNFTDEVFIPAISSEKNNSGYNSGFIHPGEIIGFEEAKAHLRNITNKYRITFSSLSTKDDIGKSLKEFFHRKKRVAL